MRRQPYVIQTERLGMRRYVVSDIGDLRPVFADPYAAKFYPAMNQPEALARWINWNLKNYDEYGFGLWALELLENGLFIGDAGITYQNVAGERILEIGWHIHPSFRSLGYATEAGNACLQFGFKGLHAANLGSIVDPANIASIKVASRVHAEKREYEGNGGPMLLFTTTKAQFAAKANRSIPVIAQHDSNSRPSQVQETCIRSRTGDVGVDTGGIAAGRRNQFSQC
jgi:RimJ/RimL family protein N-acetyltransferase